MSPREELIDAGAEAGWQDEAMRATGKPRFEEWREQSDATREKWRGAAEAILLCFEAHAGGIFLVPKRPTGTMITVGRRAFEPMAAIITAANAASPYAPAMKP